VVHYELFEARRCLELLSSRYLTMCDNVSRYTETSRVKDLTQRPRNLVVEEDGFTLDTESVHASTSIYMDMIKSKVTKEISRAKRSACRILIQRLGFAEPSRVLARYTPEQFDEMNHLHVMAGLTECSKLPSYKLLGAMINPLFQNESAMIDAGMYTDEQYQEAKLDMVDRMANSWLRTETPNFEDRQHVCIIVVLSRILSHNTDFLTFCLHTLTFRMKVGPTSMIS